MNSYDGLQRFQNELAENTRKTKEVLCAIRTDINALQQATQQYNTNEQIVLTGTTTVTLPANTYHSYSFVIFSGTVDITEGGILFENASVGYYGDSSATTLLTNSVIFTGKESGTKVIIKTLR